MPPTNPKYLVFEYVFGGKKKKPTQNKSGEPGSLGNQKSIKRRKRANSKRQTKQGGGVLIEKGR